MKICNHCGAQLDDQAGFCTNCGNAVPTYYQPPQPQQPLQYQYTPAPKQPITVGGWIGRSLIPLIPFVGGLVYIIMLFIWGGDNTKEDTFRNWAKAQLIVMAISIGLGILLGIIIAAAGASILSDYSYYY